MSWFCAFLVFIAFLERNFSLTHANLSLRKNQRLPVFTFYKWEGSENHRKKATYPESHQECGASRWAKPWSSGKRPFSGKISGIPTLSVGETMDDKGTLDRALGSVEKLLSENYKAWPYHCNLASGHDEEVGGANGGQQRFQLSKS